MIHIFETRAVEPIERTAEWDKGELPEDVNGHSSLHVGRGRKHLGALDGNGRVACDERCGHTAKRFDAERERGDIDKYNAPTSPLRTPA